MPSRLVFFAGAPEASSLNWNVEQQLLHDFTEPIARFIDNLSSPGSEIGLNSSLVQSIPYWRSIPLVSSGISRSINPNSKDVQFFSPTYLLHSREELGGNEHSQSQNEELVDGVLSQFYEISYGVYQDVPSSQIEIVSQSTGAFMSDKSSFDSYGSFDSLQSTNQYPRDVPHVSQISNLKDIPNTSYLDSINPQTMTVNLIGGIISIPEPRLITTRHGANVKLVEAIIGDETKSGFAVNFWLSPEQDGGLLSQLRPQDVILIRNVALSSFRGRVYGQSLRKGVTKVELFYRKRVDNSDIGGCYATADLEDQVGGNWQLRKTNLVREWVQQFVGGASLANVKVDGIFTEALPPDTPLSQ